MPRELTWERLVELEPRLRELERVAREHKTTRNVRSCPVAFWYGYFTGGFGLKGRMMRLVGWTAERRREMPEIGTGEAYDEATRYLYDALPDCRARCCNGR